MNSAAELIDLERYPVLTPDALRAVLDWAREQLRDTGACELPGFLSRRGLAAVEADSDTLATQAYRSEGLGTAYLGVPDFELPEDHPRRYFGRAAVGVVAYDMFPSDAPLRRLYEWDPFMRFIEAVLQRGMLYRYILRSVGDRSAADELYQETWSRVIASRERIGRFRASAAMNIQKLLAKRAKSQSGPEGM